MVLEKFEIMINYTDKNLYELCKFSLKRPTDYTDYIETNPQNTQNKKFK